MFSSGVESARALVCKYNIDRAVYYDTPVLLAVQYYNIYKKYIIYGMILGNSGMETGQ